MSIFKPTDLFVVQRTDADGAGHYSVSVDDMEKHFEASPAVFFRGAVDLTIDSSGQLDPNPPLNGDLYIGSTAGSIHSSWTGIAGQPCTVGDRVVWDSEADAEGNQGPGAKWILIQDASGGGVVEEIGSQLPIRVNDSTGGASEARPVITVDDATTTVPGVAIRAIADDFTVNADAGRAERDGHPIFATPADVRAYSVDVGDLSGITQDQADIRYLRKDAAAGDQEVSSTGKVDFKGSAEFAGAVKATRGDGDVFIAIPDEDSFSAACFIGDLKSVHGFSSTFLAGNLDGDRKVSIYKDGSATFAGGNINLKPDNGGKLEVSDFTLESAFGYTNIKTNATGFWSPDNWAFGPDVSTPSSAVISLNATDGSAEFSGGNTKIESGDENDNQYGLIHYQHPDLPDNDYEIETNAPDTMLPSKGYIKKALNNVSLAFKFIGTRDMREAPPADAVVGNVYVHLRDIPEDGSDPYEENVGDVMHPGWVNAWNTEGLADGAIHPLPRTMEKAFLGDFVGAGVNWWAKIGKVDDIGPEDLLQNLESVLTKGNDSTKGLTLGCDDPGEGNDPNPSTAKITLDNDGSAKFAGNVELDTGLFSTGADKQGLRIYHGGRILGRAPSSFTGSIIEWYWGGATDPAGAVYQVESNGSVNIGGAIPASPNIRLDSTGSATFKGDVAVDFEDFTSGNQTFDLFIGKNSTSNFQLGLYTTSNGTPGTFYNKIGNAPFLYKVGGTSKLAITNEGSLHIGGAVEEEGIPQPNVKISSIGSAEFTGKVTAAPTEDTDPDNTVVTKGYLGGAGGLNNYLLKDFSSYPSITTATTAVTADEPADEIEIETSTY